MQKIKNFVLFYKKVSLTIAFLKNILKKRKVRTQ